MMSYLTQLHISFNPLYFFSGLAVFLFIFVFWTEGKRDGFDKYKLFDVIFSTVILSVLAYLASSAWVYNLQIFHYDSIFLRISPLLIKGTLIYVVWTFSLLAFARHLKWSSFRLLDIFAVSMCLMLLPLVLYAVLVTKNFTFMWLYLPYLAGYILIFSKRSNYGFISGFGFILLNLVNAVTVLYLPNALGRLPIALIFLTISLSVVYFRKKIFVSNTNLTKNFLDFIKKQLLSKEKDLQKQEQALQADDPFMRAGRTEDNAEDLEEAMMEDNKKEVNDARLGLIKSMRLQVKRALSFLKIGKYGICEICGKPIDPARLKVYPEATTCVEHAAKSKR